MKPKMIYRAEDRCIFYPAICGEGETIDTTQISKVISMDYYLSELRGVKLMEEVDPNHNFTLPSFIESVPRSFRFSPCDVVKCPFLQNKNNIFQIRMPFAGTDLDKVMRLTTYNRKLWNTILIEFQVMFRALCLMQDKQVSHTDIKPPNITLKDGKLFLIDTGLVISQCNLPNFRFSSSYVYNPVESVLLSKQASEEWSVDTVERMTYINNIHVAKLFNEAERNFNFSLVLRFHQDVDDFNNTRVKNRQDVIIKKLDVYGLGVTLLFIANYLNTYDKKTAQNLFDFIIKSRILCFNPIKRASPIKAYKAYRKFLIFEILECSYIEKLLTYWLGKDIEKN